MRTRSPTAPPADPHPPWLAELVVEERFMTPAARRRLQVLSALMVAVGLAAFAFLRVTGSFSTVQRDGT